MQMSPMEISACAILVAVALLLLPARGEEDLFAGLEAEDDTLFNIMTGPCGPNQFFCDAHIGNGKCIPKTWYCDYEFDCMDQSDEPANECPPRKCSAEHFTCLLTGHCIPLGYRCDGDVDCGVTIDGRVDRSDEENVHCSRAFSCLPNYHSCVTTNVCIELAKFCDQHIDCPDGSDEGAFCSNSYSTNITCKYGQKPTPNAGVRCFCPAGKKPRRSECVDDDECAAERNGHIGPCDQLCTNTEGSYLCTCEQGYRPIGGGECVAVNEPPGEPATILVTNGAAVMHTDLNFTILSRIEGRALNPLDFDHRNRSACWLTVIGKEPKSEKHVLQCASVDSFTKDNMWHYETEYALEGVEQICKDWISGNWYFLDDSYDRLFVCNQTLTACVTLVSGSLDKPKDVAIDPRVGYVFITDWDSYRASLIRVNMDGNNFTRFVNVSIIYPYGLTLDYVKRQVYWLDNYLEYVRVIDYEGTYKVRTVSSGFNIKSLHSMAFFEKYIYATDYFKNMVVRIAKNNDTAVKTFAQREFMRAYSIKVFHRQRQPWRNHPCSIANGGCEHLCVVSYTADGSPLAKCKCKEGYKLDDGGQRCLDALSFPLLLFGRTQPGSILGIPLEPPIANYQAMKPIRNLRRPTAIALDVEENEVYFSDAADYVIQKENIITRRRQLVIDSGVSNCEGLAIDWAAGNLYWSDEGLQTINVVRLSNPEWRRVIASDNMTHPRAVCVHPMQGLLFWTDWADLSETEAGRTAKIEKSLLNGDERTALISTQIRWPNGLTIDYKEGWLYWCDAFLDRVEKVRFDGRQRTVVISSDAIVHPYGLALYNGFLYWTEFRKGVVMRFDLSKVNASTQAATANSLATMYKDTSPLFEIHVFANSTNRLPTVCSLNNGGCEQFCFHTTAKGKELCHCADGYKRSPSNHSACQPVPSWSSHSRCDKEQFECLRNHQCIERKYLCDSDDDCKDGSDEDSSPEGPCYNHTCRADQFRCKSNRCLPKAWVCDGDHDCQDGDDEVDCQNTTCGPNYFQCKVSKKCILQIWECDHELDCGPGDTSDEHENCVYPPCNAYQFTCANKQCISALYVCDGDRDCRDGSDELHCDFGCQPGVEFRCSPTSACINSLYKCDGYPDCDDGSDEADCPPLLAVNSHSCTVSEFHCQIGECIRSLFRCDGYKDCLDGSDEFNCANYTCHPSLFVCKDSHRCLPDTLVCDGKKNCEDGSDEANCGNREPVVCTGPYFRCLNDSSICLHLSKLCDRSIDCPDGSDEFGVCDEHQCLKSNMKCQQLCYDTPYGFSCSCNEGYYLQTDGRTCSAKNPCDQWGICSQHCEAEGAHHYCYCQSGYALLPDKFSCKSTDPAHPYIIFANRHELRMVGLRDDLALPLATNLRNTIAVDFFYKSSEPLIFWTDIATDKIYRGRLVDQALEDITVVVQHGIATAEGIAVDWISRNLYWVDSTLDQIEAARFDGTWRTVIVSGEMQNLRALAIDPRKGLLFWTDWEESNPRIERCTLAGNGRVHNLLEVSQVSGGWPNGLTIDYIPERLYWIDAKTDSIHTVDYDGRDHHLVLSGNDFLSHPFAISIFEDFVYWTDWRVSSIVRANKWNGTNVQIIQGTSAQPFDIEVMHPSRQPKSIKSPCGVHNGGCSHYCLLESSSTYSCKCPYMYHLHKDGKQCLEVENALLYSQRMRIVGLSKSDPDVSLMPVITSSSVENVSSIDVDPVSQRVYWIDTKANAIYRAFLNGSASESIIDSDLTYYGLSIDWVSRNLFFIAYSSEVAEISVSSLDAEFRRVVIQNSALSPGGILKPKEIVVHPFLGRLYWIEGGTQPKQIKTASMNGDDVRALNNIPANVVNEPTSLRLDIAKNCLYWIDSATSTVHSYDLLKEKVKAVSLPANLVPAKLDVAWDSDLYVVDEETLTEPFIAHVTLNPPAFKVLRYNVSRVTSLRSYSAGVRTAQNACTELKLKCKQLCIPLAPREATCACGTGYTLSPDKSSCIGQETQLLFCHADKIVGVNERGVRTLAPIPGAVAPSSLDFYATEDRIFWTDTARNQINSIRRDLSDRKVVLSDRNVKLGSLAVDWIAGNIYWSNGLYATDAKQGVIEVARLNGSHRYIVVHDPYDIPRSVRLDPNAGYLFWLNTSGIQRAWLDGSEQQEIVSVTNCSALEVDTSNRQICWLNQNRNELSCADYDGGGKHTLQKYAANVTYITAFTMHNRRLYWSDRYLRDGNVMYGDLNLRKNDLFTFIQVTKQRPRNVVNGLKMFDSRVQSGSNSCLMNNGGCQELCLYRGKKNGHQCACSFGKLADDRRRCIPHDSFLAYSRIQSIEFSYLSEEENANAPFPPLENRQHVRNVVGLAYDYRNQHLFYSDIHIGSIFMVNMDTKGKKASTFVEKVSGEGSVEGLAYDYLHDDLYWTSYSNASINRIHVGAHKTLQSRRVKVLQLDTLSDKPRGIALDPCQMKLFWTNWNENKPSVETSYFSGAGRRAIITTEIRTPNAIALDYGAQKLYWSDARLDKIERCEYDGSRRVVVVTGKPSHPFGLTVYKNHIYWTDWILRAVVRVNKFTGGDFSFVRRSYSKQLMGIIAVANDSYQCNVDACTQGYSKRCQDLCTVDEYGEPKCTCTGKRLISADGISCIDPESICDPVDEFHCLSGQCIPYEFTCDGVAECKDADDENVGWCATRSCATGYIRCNSGLCIKENKLCNGVNDCGDFSDENFSCPCDMQTQFRCNSGACIGAHFRCDHHPDCNDASDEMNCPARNCSAMDVRGKPMINCNFTTQCILPAWICDGSNDCWDNSDEMNCPVSIPVSRCSTGMFACRTNNRCIPISWRCDDDKDCPDGSDEEGCKHSCDPVHEFECHDKICIAKSYQCDGTPDCTSGEDEDVQACVRTLVECKEFKCPNGRCVPKSARCDGKNDCGDEMASDEQNCQLLVTCADFEFQCKNGFCLNSEFYCDGRDDCGDGSDEPSDCYKLSCLSSQFQCNNGRCIPMEWKCNGVDNCQDNSDEDVKLCFDLLRPSCKENAYQCANKVCIDKQLTCDGRNDCGDWSDEGHRCHVDECSFLNNPCDHFCVDEKIGYTCTCRPGFKLADDQRTCIDIDECNSTFSCSQLCTNRYGSFECACAEGYALLPDGRTCKHNDSVQPELLVSSRYVINRYTLSGKSKGHVLANVSNPVALDYDPVEDRVYWSDTGAGVARLCRVFLNGTDWQVLHSHDMRNPDGLAVDWVGRNLYWCDKGTDTIEVSKLDGRFRKVLMRSGALKEPRAIVLDPFVGYLFWTDWGSNAHIGRMSMDGQEPMLIVSGFLKWPNALTIDYVTRYLFWGDAGEDYIGMADYNGTNVRIVSQQNVLHIFSVAVFEDYLYWTDWVTGRIDRLHKYSGLNHTVVVPRMPRLPMGIRVVHPLVKPARKQNPCYGNALCMNLCLLSATEPKGHSCACPDGFRRQDDSACIPDCKPSQFACQNTFKCIPLWWRCDKQDDCGDGQDEMYFIPGGCPPFHCMPGEFACNNGTVCIDPSRICDGHQDCPDGADEGRGSTMIDCRTYDCLHGQWKCRDSAVCISRLHVCDGSVDCPGGEDERNCGPKSCEPGYFLCPSSKNCIPNVWLCDGQKDCDDGKDEELNCHNRTCSASEFRCPEGRCIPKAWRCDGEKECKDGADEENCGNEICSGAQFRCADGRCIPASWHCDGHFDCADLSDEFQCTKNVTCDPNDEWPCADGRHCITKNLLCNGERDCPDASDESPKAGCNPRAVVCMSGQFACKNGLQCVPSIWKCDGEADCSDQSDEYNCDIECSRTEFQCHSSKQCIKSAWVCDGQDDCPDGSDENVLMCATRACLPSFRKCSNWKCYPAHLQCDGVKHCEDGSDELPALCKSNCQFMCRNGHCISMQYRCDGFDDCGDLTDEEDCAPNPCMEFGMCSQKCEINKVTRLPKCSCDDGYLPEFTNRNRCKASGVMPLLLMATNEEIRTVDPQVNVHYHSLVLPLVRISSLDYLTQYVDGVADPVVTLVWADSFNGTLSRLNVTQMSSTMSRSKRIKKSVDSNFMSAFDPHQIPDVVLSDLDEPRSVAVDWVYEHIYWTDSKKRIIGISSLDGSVSLPIVVKNLGIPYGLAVSPIKRLLFWTDVGTYPRIEGSGLDGTFRYVLVSKNLLYPTGLTVDHPNERIYWADPKTSSIETINFAGANRRLVKTFGYAEDKPWLLDVFEDTLYFSTFHENNVKKLVKFGNESVTTIVEHDQMPHPVDVTIFQLSKQKRIDKHACSSLPCPDDSLCVPLNLTRRTFTCLCNAGKIYDRSVSKCVPDSSIVIVPECPLQCHNGAPCVLGPDGQPFCRCPAGYGGDLCQNNLCYTRCLNGGFCRLDKVGLTCDCPLEYDGDRCERYKCTGMCAHGVCYIEAASGIPKCRCEADWTGERCDISRDVCDGYCYNNGTCEVMWNKRPYCMCPSTHRGPRCQHCLSVECFNEGICLHDKCFCKVGFSGHHCETDLCDGYCANGGTCLRNQALLKCKCPVRFAGEKCTEDRCVGYCQNGGLCRASADQLYCLCQSAFTGDRCEKKVTCPSYCFNGGTCHQKDNELYCNCTERYTGERCEVLKECQRYCANNATCTFSRTQHTMCICPRGLGGPRCVEMIAQSCDELDCHRGVCETHQDRVNRITCSCYPGWRGSVCNLPTCHHYCLNGGSCRIVKGEAVCSCPSGIGGDRCEITSFSSAEMETFHGSQVLPSIILGSILVIVLILLGLYSAFFRVKVRGQFKHNRMHDELQNPAFLYGEDEEMETFNDEGTNFSNPMYDTVYKDTVANVEEHSLLAEGAIEAGHDGAE
ncbi:hypothetical protein M513_05441 [Trichuris suis]|uniref:EGF-like domain-containing protein n=1 Tax=Trichuris suis TaxID=68888 RepID=A0A085M940_9BILA|nr:hypothetical protein M513_05441 [Trichuris suis]